MWIKWYWTDARVTSSAMSGRNFDPLAYNQFNREIFNQFNSHHFRHAIGIIQKSHRSRADIVPTLIGTLIYVNNGHSLWQSLNDWERAEGDFPFRVGQTAKNPLNLIIN